jgi:peptide/nickel transport system permease protein
MILSMILRRLPYLVGVLIGISIVVFLLTAMVPGDVAQALLGSRATPKALASVRAEYGLDKSLWVQYGLFLKRLIHGDLGYSIMLQQSVRTAVATRLPVTMFLIVYASMIAITLCVPLAVIAAVWEQRLSDRLIRIGVIVGLSLPTYWVGIMLVLFVALRTGLFPVTGYGYGFLQHLWYLFLPSLTLALTFLAVLVRALRTSLVEVLRSDYVALARMKGISRPRLLIHHILRSGLLPVVTLLGLNISFLIGGTVIVESIFGVPGIGSLIVNAMLARDLQVVQGVTLVVALLVVSINLIADVLYAKLDPRVTTARQL